MNKASKAHARYFLSYSGVTLPLNLVSPLKKGEEDNRNTYYRGYYDHQNRLLCCEKVVYGDVEMEHRYHYHDNGAIKQALITMDGEIQVIDFDGQGVPV